MFRDYRTGRQLIGPQPITPRDAGTSPPIMFLPQFRRSAGVRLLTLALSIWIGYGFVVLAVSLRDGYVGYSGTVVDKGWNNLTPRTMRYLVIRDSTGHEHRRYVSRISGGWIPVGTFVVKRRGIFAPIETPGTLTPWQMLDSADKVLARHGISTKDANKNNPLENPGPSGILLLVVAMWVLLRCHRALRRKARGWM